MRLPQALFYLFLALVVVVLLTSCTTSKPVPVTYKFPQAPDTILQPCKALLPYQEQTLSGIIQTTSDNIAIYHDCADQNAAWIDWYTQQKAIAAEANKK